MATKADELELANRGQGCLGKAANGEPVFILRAQDRFAPEVVERWALLVEQHTKNSIGDIAQRSKAKVKEARALAHNMRAWQELHACKTPD